MKFFPYPVTSAHLSEFCLPGSGPVYSSFEDWSGAINGFVALRDFNAIEDPAHPFTELSPQFVKLSALPWDLFDRFPEDHQHHDASTNRRRSSWVLLDDHSLEFPRYRDRLLFLPDGSLDLFGWFAVGQAAVGIPPQSLNLVRKLPHARIFTPRTSAGVGDSQKVIPFRYNGGLGFLGGLSTRQRQALPCLGGICSSVARDSMPGGTPGSF